MLGYPSHTRGLRRLAGSRRRAGGPYKTKKFAGSGYFRVGDQIFFVLRQRLPFALKRKIIAAHFTSSGRRVSGAFSHSLFYFGTSGAALDGLLFRVFGEANAFHQSPGRLRASNAIVDLARAAKGGASSPSRLR